MSRPNRDIPPQWRPLQIAKAAMRNRAPPFGYEIPGGECEVWAVMSSIMRLRITCGSLPLMKILRDGASRSSSRL